MSQEDFISEEEKKRIKKANRALKRDLDRKNDEIKRRFGLTPEKKRKLRILIWSQAKKVITKEAEQKEEAKRNYINKMVKPLPEMKNLNEAQLVSICKDFHKLIVDAEETRYDLEKKIMTLDYEINELTIKVNDLTGKFIKPILNKVTIKILAKTDKADNSSVGFGVSLKSTGIDKFALGSKEDDERANFREQLKLTKKETEDKEE